MKRKCSGCKNVCRICVLGMHIRGRKGSGNKQRYKKRKKHTKNEVKKVTKKTGK